MIIREENFKWHLEAFASELFIYKILWTQDIILAMEFASKKEKGGQLMDV